MINRQGFWQTLKTFGDFKPYALANMRFSMQQEGILSKFLNLWVNAYFAICVLVQDFKKRRLGVKPKKIKNSPFLKTLDIFDENRLYSKSFEKRAKVEDIIRVIQNDAVKVVSFDIFETLVMRPTIEPTDIFWLIHRKVEKELGVDFLKVRANAEKKLGKRNATIDEIYEFIEKTYLIPHDVAEKVKKVEMDVEEALLFPRASIVKAYSEAKRLKKRIIAVSDMYLPSVFLKRMLQKKGFEVDKVYVSCEIGARKDDGELFSHVINEEKVCAYEIFHIGDNRQSDYEIPLKMGLGAVCVPSVIDFAHEEGTLWHEVMQCDNFGEDRFTRIIAGFALKKYEEEIFSSPMICKDERAFGHIAIGLPALTAILSFINNEEIQQYSCFNFAGRDGYIPEKIYHILREKCVQTAIPSRYIEAGRILYYTASHDTFEKFFTVAPPTSLKMPVRTFLENMLPRNLSDGIIASLPKEALQVEIGKTNEVLKALNPVRDKIESHIKYHNVNLCKYYGNIMAEKRNIVFDCGYSGSISVALGAITGKKIDKAYLWSDNEEKNSICDEKLGTKTFCAFGSLLEIVNSHIWLVFEELFSPLNKRAANIDDDGNIGYFNEDYTKEMEQNLGTIQDAILELTTSFAEHFKELARFLSPVKSIDSLRPLFVSLYKSPYCENGLLKNICFRDAMCERPDISLAEKIESSPIYENNALLGIGFTKHDEGLLEQERFAQHLGVHIHLYNTELLWEFTHYLKTLPKGTDIYITTPRESIYKLLLAISASVFSNCNTFPILSKNRGRDVGPWLVETRNVYEKYDIFCHVHSKKSVQNDWGDKWRNKLLSELFSQSTYRKMATMDSVGIFLPRPSKDVVAAWRSGIPVMGQNCEMVTSLVSRALGKHYIPSRSDLTFAVGTMFWFRPAALKKLYDLNLSYDDFPEEPIGLDGTLAHAIERIPGIIAKDAGYKVGYLDETVFSN